METDWRVLLPITVYRWAKDRIPSAVSATLLNKEKKSGDKSSAQEDVEKTNLL